MKAWLIHCCYGLQILAGKISYVVSKDAYLLHKSLAADQSTSVHLGKALTWVSHIFKGLTTRLLILDTKMEPS